MDISELQRRLAPALIPFGVLYAQAMRLRRRAFESGRLHQWRPNCPVVSVGNIGWGGSGKTPMCGHILRLATARGERAVVLTRGYGAKPHRLPLFVTPTENPTSCGDEPLLLARSHPDARVVVDPVRRRSGPWAYERFDPDFVLLDDGFQHLPVARDLDLVLLTPHDLGQGWDRVCPAGTWREGASALSRAGAFCVKVGPSCTLNGETGGDDIAAAIRRRLAPLGRPVYTFFLRPGGLKRLDGKARAADLGGERYVLATGIADPAQAAATAQALLGSPPALLIPFADHHAFTAKDVTDILAKAAGAQVLVTAKDAVKLSRLSEAGAFWALRTKLEWGPAHGAPQPFDQWFTAELDALAERYRPLAASEHL
ncbi:lipid-A-disaccharide kinase [Humidesulfovibrio mexicanus]|uniref:Tetraacyldisaccharide 4'-kinase n=1 Tax=Humidesulfovibrio mexicanus TaxID=147047 RepID=A0A239CMP0_9BACT|nr:tetraacyldisaccharide 4'-kinase [Humidesulfovibrio mexicanus]SNS20613.1 lipid-A-disaccharide kinase [Humidesulfovibrio mexicanus]